MLIVSVTPVTTQVAVGRVPRPADVSRPQSTLIPTAADTRPGGSTLTDLVRPLLDPATQLAAHDNRAGKGADGQSSDGLSSGGQGASGQNAGGQGAGNPLNLSDEEKQQVRELRQTDAEVHRHEQAHASVGGPYAGLPTYEYVRGPDGQRYAVAGEVSIDTSPAKDPAATIRKMEIVIKAALAPADPSPQDHAIANKARQIKAQAVAEKRAEQIDELTAPDDAGEARAGATPLSEQAASLYQRIAGLVSEPLGLVTPQTTVEVVV